MDDISLRASPDRRSLGKRVREYAIVLGVCLVIAWLLLPATRSGESPTRARCASSLQAIATAMYHYHDHYGCFPPAYVADADGRPMHSWRVLLLPFLDGQALYDRYRFDEPWDSPHNLALARDVPRGENRSYSIYHCATDRDSDKWDTSYVMVVGPQTISDGPNSITYNDFPDGASTTIIVAEMSDSGISWMEPRDLKFDEMSFKINDPDRVGIRSKHSGVVMVATGDGSVHTIPADIDPKILKALLTRNGGEQVTTP
jgi:hypothetical protein